MFPIELKIGKIASKTKYNIAILAPNEDTFDEIKFIMTNGNIFIICADDAYVDGYVMAWSTHAKEPTIQYK